MSTGFYHPNSMDPLLADAQDANDYSLLSKAWAIQMDGPVEGSEYSSKWNATLSAQKAGEAAGSADDALAYSLKASQWAEYPENSFVPGTSSYSAMHWALQAQAAANSISQGPTTFIGLYDTPTDYTGHAGKIVAVTSGEDGVEFIDAPTGGGGGFVSPVPLGDMLEFESGGYGSFPNDVSMQIYQSEFGGQMIYNASSSGSPGHTFQVNGADVLRIRRQGSETRLGVFGSGGTAKAVVSGSHGGNAALQSLLSALAGYGLITNSTTS